VNDLDELSRYAIIAEVVFDDLLQELRKRPDISAYPLTDRINHEPLPLTHVVAKICQKDQGFKHK